MKDAPLPPDGPSESDLLAELPEWFTQREVIPLDDSLALVVCHESMRDIVALCRSVAEAPRPVLLTGETGVGKSLLARFIHASHNPYAPFVSRMTAGLEAMVLEKWIFGGPYMQEAGGSSRSMAAEAAGGTLVLDEMGDLPEAIQRRLLAYWDGQAAGSIKDGPVHWICATNQPLRVLTTAGTLLPEFLDRFGRIHVPPLRERKRDIPALAAYFSHLAATREPSLGSLESLAKRLARRPFPGNVRELESVVSLDVKQARTVSRQAGNPGTSDD